LVELRYGYFFALFRMMVIAQGSSEKSEKQIPAG